MSTQATSATTAAQAHSRHCDCRVYERHPCSVRTSCQSRTVQGYKDLGWVAEIRNISQSGFALALHRRFEKGASLTVELPGSDPETPIIILVRVVRVAAQPGGAWLLGCSFLSNLSEEEVRTLTGDLETAAKQRSP